MEFHISIPVVVSLGKVLHNLIYLNASSKSVMLFGKVLGGLGGGASPEEVFIWE